MAYTIDFWQIVAMGEAKPQFQSFSRYAYHDGLGGAEVFVSPGSQAIAPYMPNGLFTVEVVSSSIEDGAGKTGALAVRLYGLDNDFKEINVLAYMAGTAVVAIPTQFRRLTYAEVEQVGAYGGSNVGNITVRLPSAGATLFIIPIGFGRSASSHMVVPAGETWYIHEVRVVTDIGGKRTVSLWARPKADVTASPFTPAQLVSRVKGPSFGYDLQLRAVPKIMQEKTDLWVTAWGTTGDTVSIALGILRVK